MFGLYGDGETLPPGQLQIGLDFPVFRGILGPLRPQILQGLPFTLLGLLELPDSGFQFCLGLPAGAQHPILGKSSLPHLGLLAVRLRDGFQ